MHPMVKTEITKKMMLARERSACASKGTKVHECEKARATAFEEALAIISRSQCESYYSNRKNV